jgi:ubiquitin-activating enzyme E1
MNEFCRERKVGFILSLSYGLTALAFLDFGNEFTVNDKNGEETKQFIVINISQDEEAIVNVDDSSKKRHSYEDGEYVKFKEVLGMNEINGHEPIQIQVINPYSFKLKKDTRSF